SLASVEMTSRPEPMRRTASRRITFVSRLSSLPPMMMSVPLAGRADPAAGLFPSFCCPAFRPFPAAARRPLRLSAIKRNTPVTVGEKLFRDDQSAAADHPLPPRDHLHQLQRIAPEYQHVGVTTRHEPAFAFEAERPRRVGRHERQHLFKRMLVLDHAGAKLPGQSARARNRRVR